MCPLALFPAKKLTTSDNPMHGESMKGGGGGGGLKMLLKNTCEGVDLIVKLPAISLQIY